MAHLEPIKGGAQLRGSMMPALNSQVNLPWRSGIEVSPVVETVKIPARKIRVKVTGKTRMLERRSLNQSEASLLPGMATRRSLIGARRRLMTMPM